MIYFASSIYVLQYLDKSTQDNKEIRSRALSYMAKGKQSISKTNWRQTNDLNRIITAYTFTVGRIASLV